MAKRFPHRRGVYSYVQRGLNPHVGFLAGWLILLDYVFVPQPAVHLCRQLVPETSSANPGWVWILIFKSP